MTARPATPEEAKTALQRERDRAAELRRQLDARGHRIDAMQSELRVLAAGNPAVLPVLDRLGIRRKNMAGGNVSSKMFNELR